MSLIDQRCSAVFEAITARSVRANGHENDGMVPAKAEIHSALKADALAPAHLVMGENVIGHDCGEFTAKSKAYPSLWRMASGYASGEGSGAGKPGRHASENGA